MATLKKHGGDGVKAAGDLTRAVDKAQAEGKKRATAKHMDANEKPKSLKERLKALFEAAEFFHVENGPYTISLTPDQYAQLRSALEL
ncbi:hypothetical protein D3C71_1954240 [compost metagenome]